MGFLRRKENMTFCLVWLFMISITMEYLRWNRNSINWVSGGSGGGVMLVVVVMG